MKYLMNELSLDLPGAGWVDRSSHSLRIMAPDGAAVVLEVARDPAPPDVLAERVDADLQRAGRELRGFELLARQAFRTPAAEGIAATFRAGTLAGPQHHEVAYVRLATTLLVFTVKGPVTHASACAELLRQAVGSVRLRQDIEPPARG